MVPTRPIISDSIATTDRRQYVQPECGGYHTPGLYFPAGFRQLFNQTDCRLGDGRCSEIV